MTWSHWKTSIASTKMRLHSLSIPFREWQHEAILDFDTDLKIAKELGWQAHIAKACF